MGGLYSGTTPWQSGITPGWIICNPQHTKYSNLFFYKAHKKLAPEGTTIIFHLKILTKIDVVWVVNDQIPPGSTDTNSNLIENSLLGQSTIEDWKQMSASLNLN